MLVKKGCESRLIDRNLRRISFYCDISFAPPFVFGEQLYRMNREMLGLSRVMRKAANAEKTTLHTHSPVKTSNFPSVQQIFLPQPWRPHR